MPQVVILTYMTDSVRLVRYPGAYQVAWYARQHGYSTQVLDFLYFLNKEQRLNLYKKYITNETKIVGWAPFFSQVTFESQNGLDLVIEILEEVKENFPWIKIVVGGPATLWFLSKGHKLLSFKVDAVFKGEGEYTFLEYCDYIFKNAKHPNFVLFNSLKIIKPSRTYDISNCRMRYEENDFILPEESLSLELGRGCVFKCKFCQHSNIGKDKDDFNKFMDIIRENLIYHYEKFGVSRYHLTDDTLNSHRKRTQQFYEMTQTLPFKIEYIGFVRLDLLDIWPEQQDILPESGMSSCFFGIESLDPISCRQVGKGWGAKNNRVWIPKIKKHWGDRVIIRCSLIAGLGNETPKEWQETYGWFMDSGIDDYFYNPLHLDYKVKLSEFEKNAEKYGYRWPDGEEYPLDWKNDHTSYSEAKAWCNTLIKDELSSKKIPSVWVYAALRNQGFTREAILKSNYVDLVREKQKRKLTEKFVNDYYQKAISY